jgi:predicted nucleotidyltransferase
MQKKLISKQWETSIGQLNKEQKWALYEMLQAQLFDNKLPDTLIHFKDSVLGGHSTEQIEQIQHYLAKKPIVRAYLFGNFTKSEDTIDLLLDLETGVSHFEVLAIKEGLERLLEAPVELASSRVILFILPKKD